MTELTIFLGCYLWVGVASLLFKRYLSDWAVVTADNWWKSLLFWPVEFAMVLFRNTSF